MHGMSIDTCSIVDSIHLVHALSADHDRVDVATQVALATDGGGDRGGNCLNIGS